jgi:hypothetical protein
VLATVGVPHLEYELSSWHLMLRCEGSRAAPGFMNPEGCMIYLHRLNRYLKAPLDPMPKGQAA